MGSEKEKKFKEEQPIRCSWHRSRYSGFPVIYGMLVNSSYYVQPFPWLRRLEDWIWRCQFHPQQCRFLLFFAGLLEASLARWYLPETLVIGGELKKKRGKTNTLSKSFHLCRQRRSLYLSRCLPSVLSSFNRHWTYSNSRVGTPLNIVTNIQVFTFTEAAARDASSLDSVANWNREKIPSGDLMHIYVRNIFALKDSCTKLKSLHC